jgi:hypothetical protein
VLQLYRNGQDHANEHTDKTLDIARNTPILNLSLGATRVLVLKSKRNGTKHRIALPHGSVFVLGPRTNREWLHALKRDGRPEHHKPEEEHGARISITFRTIATFQREDGLLFGQGALREGTTLVEDDGQEEARIIRAFRAENTDADFDWELHYGTGFASTKFA